MQARGPIRWATTVGIVLLSIIAIAACGTQHLPVAPSDVSATPDAGFILLEWVDNSSDETHFLVFREESGDPNAMPGVLTELVRVPANTRQFVDHSVVRGRWYRYAVASLSPQGTSAPSEQAGGPVSPSDRPPAIARFDVTPNGGTAPLTVAFSWEVTDPDGDPLTCALDAGDGSPPYDVADCTATTTLTHIYIDGETFGATIDVSDGHGGSATVTVLIDVVPKVVNGVRVTGRDSPGMESYDPLITEAMSRYDIPGGAVAVVKDGRLVFAHGYGWSDVEHQIAVQPDDLFRIASLSKPITAAAVLELYEEGSIGLDDPAFAYLTDLEPPEGATVDPRLAAITIAELLQHSGGWDREMSFDPMSRSHIIAEAMGAPEPASSETIIRYMLGQPLQFDPGTRFAYSNFGYNVLGRVLERRTGMGYEPWVQEHVLRPAGALRMAQGRTELANRAPDEVLYYARPGEPIDSVLVPSVFPGAGMVPEPYGGFYLEAGDSGGGWIASTVDLLRFLTAVDGRPDRPDILTPATIALMTERPPDTNATWRDTTSWYAMGWSVQSWAGDVDATWWHTGGMSGTTTRIVRTLNGVEWVACFNSRTDGFGGDVDHALAQARDEVTSWPSTDLFPTFP